MNKPDLDKIWETWIRIGSPEIISYKMVQDLIRGEIGTTFPKLLEEHEISWYQFLIHSHPQDPNDLYFHIRFSPVEDNKIALPNCFVSTRKVNIGNEIAGINRALLKDEDIREAWRIIGEQSEFIVKLIKAHKADGWVPIDQIVQFMHFFFNMLLLGGRGKVELAF